MSEIIVPSAGMVRAILLPAGYCAVECLKCQQRHWCGPLEEAALRQAVVTWGQTHTCAGLTPVQRLCPPAIGRR